MSQIFSSLSIRTKLLILIFVAVLPTLGAILFSGVKHREETIMATKRDILHLAQSLAAQQEQLAASTRQLLRMLAQQPEVQRLDTAACRKTFADIQERNPIYAVINAVTPDGTVIAASLPFPPGRVNLADRKHIRDAIATRDFSAGEYVAGRVVKVPVLLYSYPVLDRKGKVIAVVSAGIKLEKYKELMAQLNLPEGSVISLADHRNVTLYRLPERDDIPPGTPIPEQNVRDIPPDSQEGFYEGTGRDQVTRIYAYKRLRLRGHEPPYLVIYVGMVKSAALRQVNMDFLRDLGLAGLGCLFAMLLAWIAGKSIIIEPIEKLVLATKRFGAGETCVQTGIPHGADELGRLAKSFDDMTNLLEENRKERIEAEEEKRRLEERLNRSEKMEALGTLAGGVAHDLNNVLGIVVGYAEMLLDEIDEASPLRADIVKIMESGNRSAAIVQDLLTLARRGVQTRQVVDLNAVIRDCQKTPEFAKLLSLNANVRIRTDLAAGLLNIMGSPVHLAKTIMNLVSNAVEALPGSGELTIATRNQSLDKPVHGYDAVNEGDYVVLSVADTGKGISDADMKHIFEPFYTKKVMGRSGTGLGLAVVWGTVKDHNGYIDVESEMGRGTTFTLYFPVTREEVARADAAVPISDYIGNDESILVVDDIKEQRELAAKMLGKMNYRVKTVASGEEAVEYLGTEKADLVVLDMIMDPGMDGLDTYRAILEIHPGQKAIIVSGFAETERVQEARSLGAGDYLRKPYVQEKLGLAVRKELDRPRMA
jgi:signal transduction histidine kinase/CheY-like chemotaxis protein